MAVESKSNRSRTQRVNSERLVLRNQRVYSSRSSVGVTGVRSDGLGATQSLYAVEDLPLMSDQRDAELGRQISARQLAQLREMRVAAACEVVAISRHVDVSQPVVHAVT